jgi:IS5 family transposase
VVIFRIPVLQQLYYLSDDQTEYPVRDRYSFSRVLDLTLDDVVPDGKTLWHCRKGLKATGMFAETRFSTSC